MDQSIEAQRITPAKPRRIAFDLSAAIFLLWFEVRQVELIDSAFLAVTALARAHLNKGLSMSLLKKWPSLSVLAVKSQRSMPQAQRSNMISQKSTTSLCVFVEFDLSQRAGLGDELADGASSSASKIIGGSTNVSFVCCRVLWSESRHRLPTGERLQSVLHRTHPFVLCRPGR